MTDTSVHCWCCISNCISSWLYLLPVVITPVEALIERPAGVDVNVPPVGPVMTGVEVPKLVHKLLPPYEIVAVGVSVIAIGAVVVYALQPPMEGTVTVTVYGIPVVLVNVVTAPVFGSIVKPAGRC